MKYYVTNENVIFQEREAKFNKVQRAEMNLIKVYPEEKRQEIFGIGGAFTEAAAYTWSRMSQDKKDKLINLYFGPKGNKYNFCRTHIQSCDFSLGNYAYVEDGDVKINTFSIERDRKYLIPFIKAALNVNKDINLLASPWSPPGFMKTNGEMNNGGKLKEEFYDSWAKLIVKYILAYKEEGISISRLTIQNEPMAKQTWDSCLFTGMEEKKFACEYLRKRLDESNLKSIKLNVWDHNKDMIIERTNEIFSDDEAFNSISGIAFHWYSGDHFEALEAVREKYPDKELIFTEGCVEYSKFSDTIQIDNAEMYAHEIIGDFKAGINGFIDWNMILDEYGGPNHVKNYCDAPIMCDTKNDSIDVKLSYYYIGHFSRYIKPGARRVLVSGFTSELEYVGFINPDNEIVLIVMNKTDKLQTYDIYCKGKLCNIQLEAHSIMTACWYENVSE
ncbi:glucosylceramidase [Clostridium sp. USBA 49]|uniref:glycoside hydrolase family 30 protein n=1 Tax=Clostridium sp. USBA 49 TaxID=1881060 RepID=UPI00099AA16B|nr:glycoside hydrolase family 30 beta sandwich domain-containing protein [Clostridium sp. USBA 49]SKA74164.1 glucosylceramidase [Clostridium sp. USBA 49]